MCESFCVTKWATSSVERRVAIMVGGIEHIHRVSGHHFINFPVGATLKVMSGTGLLMYFL